MKNQKQIQGQYAITKDEIRDALELGRALNKQVLEFAAKRGSLHIKILSAAVQYVMDLQEERKMALGDDVLLAQNLMEEKGLGDRINEPFADSLVEETEEQKKQRSANLRKMADDLDKQNEKQPELPIEGASEEKPADGVYAGVADVLNAPEKPEAVEEANA